jgi:hypothetical protein
VQQQLIVEQSEHKLLVDEIDAHLKVLLECAPEDSFEVFAAQVVRAESVLSLF